jgi:hypothetical protein
MRYSAFASFTALVLFATFVNAATDGSVPSNAGAGRRSAALMPASRSWCISGD